MSATDRELLAEYAATGSGQAFGELVGRHSAAVYSACLRILGETYAAEDAAQAVFLVLARKAGRLRGEPGLAGWLLLVARHVASRALRDEARRKAREKEAAEMAVKNRPGASWDDLRPHLDAALAALPAAQRNAVALRFIEGRSRADAAREMDCSEESLSVTASRALERLRSWLSKRGVAVPAAALGGLLAAEAGSATVPAALVATLKGIGAGAAAASVSATALAEGTMKAMMIAKVKLAAAVIGAVLAVGGGGGALAVKMAAAEPVREPLKVEPALTPDPAVTAAINALGDNASCYLPSPVKTVGEWNDVSRKWAMEKFGPGGRDYCLKAAWMSDRRRAFYCGANHGSPHRLNDAWEYDLPSNTWVMLFAPDPSNAEGAMEIRECEVRDKDGKVEKLKMVQTKRGGPTHYGHTWWGLTYEPEMKAALWMNAGGSWGGGTEAYLKQELGKDEGIYHGPPLWAFYPYEKKWKLVLTAKPYPAPAVASAMEYVPELGGAFWFYAGGMWVYESKANAWKEIKLKAPPPSHNKEYPQAEAVMCYDPDTKTVVAHLGMKDLIDKSTWQFDVATGSWSKVLDAPKGSTEVPSGFDSSIPFFYDPVAKVCLLYDCFTPDHMWTYSVKEKKWEKVKVNGPAGPPWPQLIAYHDPERNAFVVHKADAAGKVWVYRHRKTAEKK